MASAPPTIGAVSLRQAAPSNRAVLSRQLLQVIDRVPETRGMGPY
jgi:hypothetical protein